MFHLSVLTLFSVLAISFSQSEGDSCTLEHNGETGVCKDYRECPEIIPLRKMGFQHTACSYNSARAFVVCCPLETPVRVAMVERISKKKCADYKSQVVDRAKVGGLSLSPNLQDITTEKCSISMGLIVGGMKTKNGDFPHMAAFGRDNLDDVEWFCGGSVISDQFVLTAAHCKRSFHVNVFVRLGDQNIKNTLDGLEGVDYSVNEIIIHEKYSRDTKQNDIALAKLSKRVSFGRYIRPACLWQEETIQQKVAIATGWGNIMYAGSSSDELMKVELEIFNISECKERFEDETDFIINDNQICVGSSKVGMDTCQGDSGGPIQIALSDNKCISYIIGVTSYGSACGIGKSRSVYTKISAYLDWIESKVWAA